MTFHFVGLPQECPTNIWLIRRSFMPLWCSPANHFGFSIRRLGFKSRRGHISYLLFNLERLLFNPSTLSPSIRIYHQTLLITLCFHRNSLQQSCETKPEAANLFLLISS